jgi:phosphoribosylanthranilate isomerase
VRVEVKFCGMTRPEDARAAAELGARYVGVIFAGGPRNIDPAHARKVLDAAGTGVERVGVFSKSSPGEIAAIARAARIDIVQLHADPTIADVAAARASTGARVWSVVRVSGDRLPADFLELWEASDALVLDSKAKGALGGTGASFDWSAIEPSSREHERPLAVAGGLTPANVAHAIETLSADIVDVSSGVESSPGIKDHTRMAEFMDAVGRARVLR